MSEVVGSGQMCSSEHSASADRPCSFILLHRFASKPHELFPFGRVALCSMAPMAAIRSNTLGPRVAAVNGPNASKMGKSGNPELLLGCMWSSDPAGILQRRLQCLETRGSPPVGAAS